MALLLPMPAQPRPEEEDLGSASFSIRTATAHPPSPQRRLGNRAQLKAAVREQTYDNILNNRMSHIPAPLPYTDAEIVARLKEDDQEPSNRDLQAHRLDLDADLQLLAREIERPGRQSSRKAGKEGRISRIWKFLVLDSEITQFTVNHRLMRLRSNVDLFLRSDLPGSYLASCGGSTHWEVAALTLAHNAQSQTIVQRLTGQPAEDVDRDAFAATKSPLSEVERALREYQRRLQRVSILSNKVLEWRDALEYYVDLFSGPDLPSFRQPRQISVTSLDPGIIDELARGLLEATTELRRMLAGEYPGGLSEFRWMARDDPYVTGLLRLELGEALAG